MDMKNKGLFSSHTDQWATPQDLFDKLDKEFNFEVDVCASHTNYKCPMYWTKREDGLKMEWWRVVGEGSAWMNPPYGREIGAWVEKAFKESQRGLCVVALLPARTDTRWFHDFVYGKTEIRFIKGRLKFGGVSTPAPFPSMIVVFRGSK